MKYADFNFDEQTPEVLKNALLSMNSNKRKGSDFFQATGLDVYNYLKDEKKWYPDDLNRFELGLYVALELTKKSALDALKGMLKFP